MNINTETISQLKPCENRFDNFKENYPNFEGDLKEFLALDKITFRDKLWVTTRLMTRTQKVKFAILNAESVLHLFEAKYPDKKEVRNLIEHLKTIESFESLTEEQVTVIRELRRAAAAAYAAAAYAADAAYADAARKQQEGKALQFVLDILN